MLTTCWPAHRPLFWGVIDVVRTHVAVDLHQRGGARWVDGVHPAQARSGSVYVAAVCRQRRLLNHRWQQRGEHKPELEKGNRR